jgi:hypothetical protein
MYLFCTHNVMACLKIQHKAKEKKFHGGWLITVTAVLPWRQALCVLGPLSNPWVTNWCSLHGILMIRNKHWQTNLSQSQFVHYKCHNGWHTIEPGPPARRQSELSTAQFNKPTRQFSSTHRKATYRLHSNSYQLLWPTAAFFKLWFADHKWSSGSALVVLILNISKKKDKKNIDIHIQLRES